MKVIAMCLLLGSSFVGGACVPNTIKVKPVLVEPIHLTVDVNINDQPTAPAPAKPEGQ